MTTPSLDSQNRREFMKAVVAVGGTSALSACIERTGEPDYPRGTTNTADLPPGQHNWGITDDHGNPGNPEHHILRFLKLPADYTPTEEDRITIENALQTIEEAYEWSRDGAIVTIGYSPSYFDRFDEPVDADLPDPEPLAPFEDPTMDSYDAVVHITSDHADATIEIEEALFGERDTVNGIEVTNRLSSVFTTSHDYPDRRTGFVGPGLPKKFIGEILPDIAKKIPEKSPLSMGFESSFKKNQASEDTITIKEGAFEGGTTQQISPMTINLNQWWTQDDRWQRVAKMFSPTHAQENLVEGVGENFTDNAKMDQAAPAEEAASMMGLVGHAQKMIKARKNDEPRILRRDFDTIDQSEAGLHFLSHQRTIEDFKITRDAMNGTEISEDTAVGTRNNNGILQYIRTTRRGNYLLPPRELRALPSPTGQ